MPTNSNLLRPHVNTHSGCLYLILSLGGAYATYKVCRPTQAYSNSGPQQWLCGIECRTCNREVAGTNLGRGYFAPRSTQPSIPPGSVNEYQLWLGRQRQVWLIPLADKMQGVQVKLCYPLTMRTIPEHLKIRFMYRRYTNRPPLPLTFNKSE